MKGVVLAGGTGSRLSPLTRVTNKHLLPNYDKPMVYYPIQSLVNAGIQEILLVTGRKNASDFLRLLGNGRIWTFCTRLSREAFPSLRKSATILRSNF